MRVSTRKNSISRDRTVLRSSSLSRSLTLTVRSSPWRCHAGGSPSPPSLRQRPPCRCRQPDRNRRARREVDGRALQTRLHPHGRRRPSKGGLPAHARPAPVFARANAVASDLHARRRRLRRRAAVAGVAASVLVIAGIAVPNLLRSNLNRNEAFAIAALKNISSAQAQFQASGIADPDGDGQGR